MMGRHGYVLVCFLVITWPVGEVAAQAVRALPYSAQLRTDPAVGNIQGIQRYGRPLKTDPDQGEGFSYYVYPVAYPQGVSTVQSGSATGTLGPPVAVGSSSQVQTPLDLAQARALSPEVQQLENKIQEIDRQLAGPAMTAQQRGQLAFEKQELQSQLQRQVVQVNSAISAMVDQRLMRAGIAPDSGARELPEARPFNATAGWRNPAPASLSPGGEMAQLSTAGLPSIAIEAGITHQPLIQVKVRVVEVDRSDGLLAESVLDYVSSGLEEDTYITGNNINKNFKNGRGSTRFDVKGLLGVNGTALNSGQGMLFNVTRTHINWILSLLAQEFSSDLITAPEVVTLNGQNVEFTAGRKVPFELGQNVITGSTDNIQQFFYKHVGTFISVTPRIVNFGPTYKGGGKVPSGFYQYFGPADLIEPRAPEFWDALVAEPGLVELSPTLFAFTNAFPGQRPAELGTVLLAGLNELVGKPLTVYDDNGNELVQQISRRYLVDFFAGYLNPCAQCTDCEWQPSDCTIDLEIVVRLSSDGQQDIEVQRDGENEVLTVTAEDDVRAIANIVQVKSGHGIVIGGLISARDTESVSKIPVLGDIPLVGALFRSKVVNRAKRETLIFVEAQVLDPEPAVARQQSYEDMLLGQPYVQGSFLENPLEFGMYRQGFGTYLPPNSLQENIFWERLGRKVRKSVTEVDDVIK